MMRKLNNLFYLSLALGSTQLHAQQSVAYTNDTYKFDKAVALYNEQQYAIAQILFDEIRVTNTNNEIQADCAYYIANCAIRLEQDGAESKIEEFVKNYPTSSKQIDAFVEVSNFYFKKGEYEKALSYAEKINEIENDKLKVFMKTFFLRKRKIVSIFKKVMLILLPKTTRKRRSFLRKLKIQKTMDTKLNII